MLVLSCSVPSDSATPWTVTHQASLSTGFSRQEYWSGLPGPSAGNLPDPSLLCLLHWQVGSLPLAPPEKPNIYLEVTSYWCQGIKKGVQGANGLRTKDEVCDHSKCPPTHHVSPGVIGLRMSLFIHVKHQTIKWQKQFCIYCIWASQAANW